MAIWLAKAADADVFPVVFLERLQSLSPLPASHVHHLESTYSFNTSPNAEIRLRWYSLALSTDVASDYASDAAAWIVDSKTGLKGRMKFCRPVFRAVNQVNPELARETFKAHASEFHPIARRLIEKVCRSLCLPSQRRMNLCTGRTLGLLVDQQCACDTYIKRTKSNGSM